MLQFILNVEHPTVNVKALRNSLARISNIMLSRLITYAEEITGDHQCGFRCDSSSTDHIFCIHQILEKKWEYNEAVLQLLIDFKKTYDSVRMDVLYSILIEFGIHTKLKRLRNVSE
jgi:hypothetical protein